MGRCSPRSFSVERIKQVGRDEVASLSEKCVGNGALKLKK